jgi:hypothetical protein
MSAKVYPQGWMKQCVILRVFSVSKEGQKRLLLAMVKVARNASTNQIPKHAELSLGIERSMPKTTHAV